MHSLGTGPEVTTGAECCNQVVNWSTLIQPYRSCAEGSGMAANQLLGHVQGLAVYKALNNSRPGYLKDCMPLYRPVRAFGEILLMTPHPTKYHWVVTLKWAFSAAVPILGMPFSLPYVKASVASDVIFWPGFDRRSDPAPKCPESSPLIEKTGLLKFGEHHLFS